MAAPRTIAELFKMVVTMKTNFEQRMKSLEDMNASLSMALEKKEEEIRELKQAKDSQSKVIEQQEKIQKVVDNHQNFLEKTDSFRRECNDVVYGLPETEETANSEHIKEIFQVLECSEKEPEKLIRLGKPPQENNGQEAPEGPNGQPRRIRHRPLLVVCKSRQDKSDILTKVERFKKIYVKKDQTPYERKEWSRLKEVLKREKARPQNAGMEVKIDYRSKSVKVGDRIVEKGNFRRGPEW